MGGLRSLFGGGATTAVTPDYTGLSIQTAVSALPIPIVWGENKIAPNVLWYNNFQATAVSSGSGGKGGIFGTSGPTTSYEYTASLIMALCEGPIAGIGQIWRDQSDHTLADLGLSLFSGSTPQTTWSYLTTNYPAQALAYQGTAFVCKANYNLSDAATVDNHNFEVQGFFYASGINGVDADPARVIYDFITNAQYGVGSPTGTPIAINTSTLFGSGGDASLQTYCAAAGIAISPALTDQETASSILQRWLQICNCAAVWTNGELNFIPYGDTATVAGTTVATSISTVVPEAGSFITPAPTVYVCPTASFVSDGGVKYTSSGASLTYNSSITSSTSGGAIAGGTYGLSPAGVYIFSGADKNNSVTISFDYSVGASFEPDVTPIYNLDDDDYMAEANEDPVQISRTDPFEAHNVWRLEIGERANAYNLTTVEARDQNAIQLYGERLAPTVTAHEICDPNVAMISGQLMLQRAVYIRNNYKIRLSWEYCLLDPMDLITLTDSLLGMNLAPARITTIEEDDNGYLDLTLEEFPQGYATATLYPTTTPSNNPINRAYTPDSVNPPVIYEPPSGYSSTAQLWIGASGGSGGVADPLWGGCYVLLSLDGTTFQNIGTVLTPSRQGVLTASLASFSGTNPDPTDTLTVNLAESGGVLSSASGIAAQLAQTLCLVDSELLSYTTATLVSGNTYNLTGLYRGLYGTSAAAHSSGAQFLRIDNAVFEFDLPAQFVNHDVFIVLQSFNAFGGGAEPLSECTVYSYLPVGLTAHPIATALAAGTNEDLGNWTETVGTFDDFGTPWTLPVSIDVDLGAW